MRVDMQLKKLFILSGRIAGFKVSVSENKLMTNGSHLNTATRSRLTVVDQYQDGDRNEDNLG